MSNHDDRPGGAGGAPETRHYGNAPAEVEAGTVKQPVAPADVRGPEESRDLDARSFDYYDDAYSDPEMSWEESDDYYDEFEPDPKSLRWNAGTDLGLLILRLALGGVFVAHGAQKLFGVLGGPGPDGFAQMLQGMGFRESATLSLVTGVTELGGGALLVLGLFTPLAAAGLVGVMVNAVALQFGAGFFASSGGVEYEVVLGCLGLGLLFTGPGRVALDNGRSWFRHPLAGGLVGLVVAAGASAAVFFLFH